MIFSKFYRVIFLIFILVATNLIFVNSVNASSRWGEPRQLTFTSPTEDAPSISGDGSLIAYELDGDIFVISSDGTGEPIQLTENSGQKRNPCISHDGSKIAYGVYNDGIWMVNSDGTGEPIQITTFGEHPSINVDGSILAFENDMKVFVVETEGSGEPTQMCEEYEAGEFPYMWPCISGDGTKITYQTILGGTLTIFVVSSFILGSEIQLAQGPDGYTHRDCAPSISYDGTKIAYRSWKNIFVVDSSGNEEPIQVTDHSLGLIPTGTGPSISGDGSKIAYSLHFSDYDVRAEIFVVNSDGTGEPIQITDDLWHKEEVTINFDGSIVAYSYLTYDDVDIFSLSQIEAYTDVFIEHNSPEDLTVNLYVIDQHGNYIWVGTLWDRGGSTDNLDLRYDLSSYIDMFPLAETQWILTVQDDAGGDEGWITEFSITYDGTTTTCTETPTSITDFEESVVYLPCPSGEDVYADVYIQHRSQSDLYVWIGVGDPSDPIWEQRIWNGEGGYEDDLDLRVDLSDAIVYLPPSESHRWYVAVNDIGAVFPDHGYITDFSITVFGTTYSCIEELPSEIIPSGSPSFVYIPCPSTGPGPCLTTLAVASIAVIAVIGIGLIVYFKKNKR